MRILLCNDDGYQALGIQTLAQVLREHGHEIYIVAPHEERSGQSHAMTFFRPLVSHPIDAWTWAIEGTPADCAALALHHYLKDKAPDLVISGINHGLNIGWDVNYSGTVGAATEAGLLSYKAIAVSVDLDFRQKPDQQKDRFLRAAHLCAQLLDSFDKLPWPKGEILNLNHPGIPSKGLVQASCANYNMHQPRITVKEPNLFYLGGSQRIDKKDPSQDATLIQEGYATLSFLQTRQSSHVVEPSLQNILDRLHDTI